MTDNDTPSNFDLAQFDPKPAEGSIKLKNACVQCGWVVRSDDQERHTREHHPGTVGRFALMDAAARRHARGKGKGDRENARGRKFICQECAHVYRSQETDKHRLACPRCGAHGQYQHSETQVREMLSRLNKGGV